MLGPVSQNLALQDAHSHRESWGAERGGKAKRERDRYSDRDTEERARTGCVTYPQLRNTGGDGDSEAVMKHRKGPDEIERRRWKKFTSCEVVKHGILEDAWTIIYGRVYDITTFALTHPGESRYNA